MREFDVKQELTERIISMIVVIDDNGWKY